MLVKICAVIAAPPSVVPRTCYDCVVHQGKERKHDQKDFHAVLRKSALLFSVRLVILNDHRIAVLARHGWLLRDRRGSACIAFVSYKRPVFGQDRTRMNGNCACGGGRQNAVIFAVSGIAIVISPREIADSTRFIDLDFNYEIIHFSSPFNDLWDNV